MSSTQKIERLVVDQLLTDLLAAGFLISVNDGEETTLFHSTNRADILAAMFSTDEDILVADRLPTTTITAAHGWVRLIYGNGPDVISDSTINLDPYLAGANALADEWS